MILRQVNHHEFSLGRAQRKEKKERRKIYAVRRHNGRLCTQKRPETVEQIHVPQGCKLDTERDNRSAYTASGLRSAVNEYSDDCSAGDRDAAIAKLLKQHSHSVSIFGSALALLLNNNMPSNY